MPNNCFWRVVIDGITEKQKERLSRWAKIWILCEMIMPYPKDVKKDIENERKYYSEVELIKKNNWTISKEELEELAIKYPHKQLRYDWRISNWWSKWELCDCSVFLHTNWMELDFWTARSPVTPVFKALSKKYRCEVSYHFSEPLCFFSGIVERDKWEEIYHEEYSDPYYWEWLVCSKCGCVFDWTNEEDWSNLDLHICYDCWHKWTWNE